MRKIPVVVSDNIGCLMQGADLIGKMNGDHYSEKIGHCFNSSVGQHFRHILDHYDCLFHGLAAVQGDGPRIDYDARTRDLEIEENPEAGITKIEQVCTLLTQLDTDLRTELKVKMDTGSDTGDQWASSTIVRELQFLLSHTVHHFALIGTMNSINNMATPNDFGIAPSTLAYRRNNTG
ncbi:MAG: hypothetical protein HKP44_08090 [Desulfofustis sp.]|nr:hypothetical protein [Desulfofustis sp.]